MLRYSMKRLKLFFKWAVHIAPTVLAATSGYILFIVIVPFFLLGIYQVPRKVSFEEVSLGNALGSLSEAGVAIIIISLGLIPYIWILTVINYFLTRRWYLLLLLIIAPLPFAYFLAGPYHELMLNWAFPI